MNGVDFFESSLLQDIYATIDGKAVLFVPDEDLVKLPTQFPYPLVIGNTGYEELVLCTGPNRVNGVLTKGIDIDRWYFDPYLKLKTRVKGERVICAPTINYFKELYSFLTSYVTEYNGLFNSTILHLTNGDLTDHVLNWNNKSEIPDPEEGDLRDSLQVSAVTNYIINVDRGIGVCNGKIVSFTTPKTFDLSTEAFSMGDLNNRKAVLCYIDEFSEPKLVFSAYAVDPIVPNIPSGTNGLELASFKISLAGILESIMDLRW